MAVVLLSSILAVHYGII